MRVRRATAKCKAICEEATASYRATNPMRQPRDPELVALCKPVKTDKWNFALDEEAYHAAINSMLPAEEYDRQIRALQAKGRAA